MKRTVIGLMTVFLFLLPGHIGAFSDVADDDQEMVQRLMDREIITGFPDGSFRPASELTRLQAVIMIIREQGITAEERAGYPAPDFSDVSSRDFGFDYMATAHALGITTGFDDGTFRPDESVTREQMAAMFDRVYALPEYEGLPDVFSDVPDSRWSAEAVHRLYGAGIITGFGDGTFRPSVTLNRLHFSIMMDRYIRMADGESPEERVMEEPDERLDLASIAPGTTEQAVRELLGEPDRSEAHLLGYDWLIYNDPLEDYVQVAVENGVVRDVYTPVAQYEFGGVYAGVSLSEVEEAFAREEELRIEGEGVTYFVRGYNGDFESYLATDDDVHVRFYLDVHDERDLRGIRLMDDETMVQLFPFNLRWEFSSGAAFYHERPTLTEAEQDAVNRSNERILFDMVNINRMQRDLHVLDWREDIQEVAYGHSVDMEANQFFSHTSPSTGSPGDRMTAAGLTGNVWENIAMGQRDAVDANAGLMNSMGHRTAILEERLQGLGTGVSGFYYTQKFVD